MNTGEQRRQAERAPGRRAKLEAEALLADLEHTRELFAAAERRARTYLVRRGVLDQTKRDLSSLLREDVREAALIGPPRGLRAVDLVKPCPWVAAISAPSGSSQMPPWHAAHGAGLTGAKAGRARRIVVRVRTEPREANFDVAWVRGRSAVIVADADVAPARERLFGEFASTIGEED